MQERIKEVKGKYTEYDKNLENREETHTDISLVMNKVCSSFL
jgi:hypothetical protein